MDFCYGENLKISIFGQSHAPAVGVTIEGLPAGVEIDTEELQRYIEDNYEVDVDAEKGGQPVYSYIIGIE